MTHPNARALAYLGDAVYELCVRKHLILKGVTTSDRLHTEAVRYTCAAGQARAVTAIESELSPAEQQIMKRGRNGGLSRKPRQEPLYVHHAASGLEALFGHLFLAAEEQRIAALFEIVTTALDKGES